MFNKIENKIKKEAGDKPTSKALLVMHNVFAESNVFTKSKYINFSVHNVVAEHATKALLVMQQIDTLCLRGLAGSTPAWGGSAFSNMEGIYQDEKQR